MVEIVGGPPDIPGWLAARLGGASPSDGDPKKNRYLEDDGQTETNPVKTKHSIFRKGTQGSR
jgi:hypothetical protein